MKRVVVTGMGVSDSTWLWTDINWKNLISEYLVQKLANLMSMIISVKLLVKFPQTAKWQAHLLQMNG